jgi:Fe-S cluster assembly ATP-binding protein
MLRTERLAVKVDGTKLLEDINIEIKPGEIVAVMGPNGSGKTTLARAIMGDPRLETKGDIIFDGKKLKGMPPSSRSKKGIFVSFQNPPEIEGINYGYFLDAILDGDGTEKLKKAVKELGIKEGLLRKDLNVGFSGGERKKFEMLQVLLKNPKLVVFDEIDSGLDIDSIKMVDRLMNDMKREGKSVLVITHYTKIFSGMKPDRVYVLVGGKIAGRGGSEMLSRLDEYGFEEWR